jgi:hypothetical protein
MVAGCKAAILFKKFDLVVFDFSQPTCRGIQTRSGLKQQYSRFQNSKTGDSS